LAPFPGWFWGQTIIGDENEKDNKTSEKKHNDAASNKVPSQQHRNLR
jgi:hypothetical protein